MSLSAAQRGDQSMEFSSNQYCAVMTCKHNEHSVSGRRFKGAPCYLLELLPIFCCQLRLAVDPEIRGKWRGAITAAEPQSFVSVNSLGWKQSRVVSTADGI